MMMMMMMMMMRVVVVVLLLLKASTTTATTTTTPRLAKDHDRLPGWRGETHSVEETLKRTRKERREQKCLEQLKTRRMAFFASEP